jgi:hypothetical protein
MRITIVALVSSAMAVQAMGNVVGVSGSIAGGPVGTPGVVSIGGSSNQAFNFSGTGASVQGTSVASTTGGAFNLATAGFQSMGVQVTDTGPIDFTLVGQYEFDYDGLATSPITFGIYSFTGNSAGRTLTVTFDSEVDANAQQDLTIWNAALPGAFQSGATTPSQAFSASQPTLAMSVTMRFQLSAGDSAVSFNSAEFFQRAVWVPAPSSAALLVGAMGMAMRRRRE